MTYTIGRMICMTKLTLDQINELHKREKKADYVLGAFQICRIFDISENVLPYEVSSDQERRVENEFIRILKKIKLMPDDEFDKLSQEDKIKYNEHIDFCHSCDLAIYNDIEFTGNLGRIFQEPEAEKKNSRKKLFD